MGPECKVCRHPRLADLHAALDAGGGVNATARAFGVDPTTLKRHLAKHERPMPGCPAILLPPADDGPNGEAAEGDVPATAAEWVERLSDELGALLLAARTEGSIRDRAAAVTAALPLVEKLGRLTGELGPDRELKMLSSSEWLAVQATTIDALRPFPEALEACVRAWKMLAGRAPAES